jgi:nucleoside-diphosphate-sugar epimerase
MKNLKIFFLFFLIVSKLTFCNEKFLVFGGKTGWIGSKIVKLLEENNYEVFIGESRLENRHDLLKEIRSITPDFVINCAGLTGNPNVDWCEDHKQDVIRTNVIGTLNLFDICSLEKIHLTNFGTGCVYEYDEEHPVNSGIGFSEEEQPNFKGSFYSQTKAFVDSLIKNYPTVLNLRLRMPISSDLHPKNFIKNNKIQQGYKHS